MAGGSTRRTSGGPSGPAGGSTRRTSSGPSGPAGSSRRERELARARLERQAARRAAERARRRRRNTVVAAGLAVLLVVGGLGFAATTLGGDDSDSAADPGATPTAESTTPAGAELPVACGGQRPAPVTPQTYPSEPPLTVDATAAYRMTLTTSCGPIVVAMDARTTPRTVNTLAFLAEKGFYDGSFCHRMVQSEGLTVLQCGDPEGTGSGGPGFTIGEENVAGATYARGTVAMAKTSAPNSTSSQFFLVAKDSQLPPEYTPVGTIAEGLDNLDEAMAVGQDDSNGPGDGAPRERIHLEDVTVTKV